MIEPTGVPIPERAAPRPPRVVHVPWLKTVKATFLGRTFHGEMLHFDPKIAPHGRDVPCAAPLPCRLCDPGASQQLPRYTGFAAVLLGGGAPDWIGRAVLSLPYELAKAVLSLLIEPHGLRGQTVTLRRGESKRNDSIQILDVQYLGEPALPEFAVIPVIENTWGKIGYYEARQKELWAHQRGPQKARVLAFGQQETA